MRKSYGFRTFRDNGHFRDQFIQNWKAFSHQRNEIEKENIPGSGKSVPRPIKGW
jgi:hypothetical protein